VKSTENSRVAIWEWFEVGKLYVQETVTLFVTDLLSHPAIELPLTLNAILPPELAHAFMVIEPPSAIRGIDKFVTPITVIPEKVELTEAE
jgi:hypothetical protein